MVGTRARPSFTAELLTTSVSAGLLLLVGLLAARELRVAPAALAEGSRPVSSVAAAVPPDAVSVPALVLNEGTISVGDRPADAVSRLHGSVTQLRRIEERGPLGIRDVRSYQHASTDFILVVEPFERGGEPRVAAIYVK